MIICITTARLEKDFSLIGTCGDLGNGGCTTEDCALVPPEENNMLQTTFFGTGSCMPKKLVKTAEIVRAGFSTFASLITADLLPTYADILTCLKKTTKDDCKDVCGWCEGISKDAYPLKTPLTQLCLPSKMSEDVCTMLMDGAKELELCPGKSYPDRVAPTVTPRGRSSRSGAHSSAPLISCMTSLCLWLMFHN